MINLLIQSLGKSKSAIMSSLTLLLNESFVYQNSGEKLKIHSQEEGLILIFDEEDVLRKIEILPEKKWCTEFEKECLSGLKIHNREVVIKVLGKPTTAMSYPGAHKDQEQLLYDKNQYWLSIKFKSDMLECIALLDAKLIPENIRKNQVPIRICKSKK